MQIWDAPFVKLVTQETGTWRKSLSHPRKFSVLRFGIQIATFFSSEHDFGFLSCHEMSQFSSVKTDKSFQALQQNFSVLVHMKAVGSNGIPTCPLC
jgi:hypothetical protein